MQFVFDGNIFSKTISDLPFLIRLNVAMKQNGNDTYI